MGPKVSQCHPHYKPTPPPPKKAQSNTIGGGGRSPIAGPPMPYLVRDRLFFGNIEDAAAALASAGTQFTHVLSVLSSPSISFFSDWRSDLSIPTKPVRTVLVGDGDDDGSALAGRALPRGKVFYARELAGEGLGIVRMAVGLRDTEDEDLIDYLDVCLDFIDEGRRDGCVLVHCFAGVSRSAAVIMAYLMRSEQRTLEDALESLRQCCEFVCPNDGFLDQLNLFEDMGFKVDTSNPLYKRFRLKVLGHSYKQGEKIDSYIFGADPGLPTQTDSEGALKIKNDKPITAYRCKKCRRVVALQTNVVSHIPREGETCFDWQKRKSQSSYNRFEETECSSIFVEPLWWMTAVEEGALEGKLSCKHCEARLGYFNWSGIQCSCGSWITPAFQIQKGRVDVSSV